MRTRTFLAAVFLLALVFLGWGAAALAITDPVESNYALTAKEMLAAGDWLSPQIYGTYWYDKPIFLYWLLEISYTLFGTGDLASRLPSLLFGAASCTLVAWFALRQGERRLTAALLAVMTATSLEVWLISRSVITDQMLFFFSGAALFFAYIGLTEKRRAYVVAAYLMAAGAVLTKGPVGLVLPGLFLLLFALSQKKLTYVKALFPPLGILCFLLLCLAWYGPMYSRHGADFINGLLGFNNVVRATVSEHPEYNVWYYYVLLVPLGLLPWTGPCLYGLWQQRRTGPLYTFLVIWALGTIVFYTCMATKYPTYTYIANLPFLYLGALTLSDLVEAGKRKAFAWLLIPALCFWLLFAAAVFFTAKIPFAVHGLWALSLFFVLLSLIVLWACWQKARPALPLLTTLGTVVLYIFLASQVLPGYYDYRSAKVLTDQPLTGRIYCFEEYRTSYDYYTGQTPIWTAPEAYIEKTQKERDPVWNQKHRYPTETEASVLARLQRGEVVTFIVPAGNYEDYENSAFAAYTPEEKQAGAYYLFRNHEGFR